MEKDDVTWNLFFHRIFRRFMAHLNEFSQVKVAIVIQAVLATITSPHYFRPAALGAYEMYFATWYNPSNIEVIGPRTSFMYASTILVSIFRFCSIDTVY